MTARRPALDSRSRFDAFLLASVREDGNGLTVSVLSTLARLDVDPWLEAARLDALSAAAATERLGAMLASPTGAPSARPGAAATAARLVALLPRGTAAPRPRAIPGPPAPAAAALHRLAHVVLAALVMIALLLGLRHGTTGAASATAGSGAVAAAPGRTLAPLTPPSGEPGVSPR
jgi:hypothetical protein